MRKIGLAPVARQPSGGRCVLLRASAASCAGRVEAKLCILPIWKDAYGIGYSATHLAGFRPATPMTF